MALIQYSYAEPEASCISYSDDNFLQVSLNKPKEKQIKIGEAITASLINTVKNGGDKGKILSHYSNADGSYAEMKKALETKNTISAYSKIESAKTEHAYIWGNYLLLWTSYAHEGKKTLLLDAFYCESDSICKLSLAFDKSSPDTDLISRFMSYVRIGGQEASCKGKSPGFSIDQEKVNKNPLSVFVNFPPEIPIDSRKTLMSLIQKDLPKTKSSCLEMIQKFDVNQPNSSEMVGVYKNIIENCAYKLTEGSGIPAIRINKQNHEKVFQIPAVMISNLQLAKEAVVIGQYSDKGRKINLFYLKGVGGDGQFYLLPSMNEGQYLLDWSYYGTAAAELIMSEHFSRYLSQLKKF